MALSSIPLECTFASGTTPSGQDRHGKGDAADNVPGIFRNAERVQESITARIEKKALLWIAARLPLWVTSDQLTCLGLGAMLVGFLLLSIESYLASYTIGVFRMSFWKFGPTEIRILLAAGNLALWWNPQAMVFGRFRLFDFGGIIAAVLMVAIFVASAGRHTQQLYRAEDFRSKTEVE